MSSLELTEFSEKIRKLRRNLDLTQQELANLCGFHVNFISGIERGEKNPTFKSIVKLARSLGVSPQDLMPTH